MARGSKKSVKRTGMSSKRAKQIGYATVNLPDGGGKKSGIGIGSGSGKKRNMSSARKGGRASKK